MHSYSRTKEDGSQVVTTFLSMGPAAFEHDSAGKGTTHFNSEQDVACHVDNLDAVDSEACSLGARAGAPVTRLARRHNDGGISLGGGRLATHSGPVEVEELPPPYRAY